MCGLEIIIYLFLPLLGSILLLGVMFYGAHRIAGRPGLSAASAGLLALFIFVATACSLLGNTLVNLCFMLLFAPAASLIFRARRECLLPFFILSVAVFLTDAAVVTLCQTLWFAGILYLNSPELAYLFLVAATRMTEFMVILLITFLTGKRTGEHVTARQIALSVILPVFSIFNLYYTAYLSQIYFTMESLVLFIVNLVLLAGLNIYFCVLTDVMSRNRRLENERRLYRRQAAMQHRYYLREEEKYEESRKLLHDIRNHIQAMEELYRAKGSPDAAEYAGDLLRMLNGFHQKYYTTDKLLNIILNDKAQSMEHAGVLTDFKVGELTPGFMRDTDITALFANLLDNAAAGAADSRGKYVRLRIGLVRHFLSITMENSCDREPPGNGGLFHSGKPGHSGLGMKIIRQTVTAYGGDVQSHWRDRIFTTTIMLPVKYEKGDNTC